MPKVVVPVTLDLSAEQIELLDRHGDLVVDLLGKAIQQAQRAKRTLDLDGLQAQIEDRQQRRKREFDTLGRFRPSDAPAAIVGRARTAWRGSHPASRRADR